MISSECLWVQSQWYCVTWSQQWRPRVFQRNEWSRWFSWLGGFREVSGRGLALRSPLASLVRWIAWSPFVGWLLLTLLLPLATALGRRILRRCEGGCGAGWYGYQLSIIKINNLNKFIKEKWFKMKFIYKKGIILGYLFFEKISWGW